MRRAQVVILVLLVLVFLALAVPRWLQHMSTTVCPKWRADVMSIEFAAEEFARDHDGRWPISIEELCAPDEHAGHVRAYLGTARPPLDPWKRPYHYDPPRNPGDPPRIWTLGRDGVP